MSISKKTLAAVIMMCSVASGGLVYVFHPLAVMLNRHSIEVAERIKDDGSTLVLQVGGKELFISLEYDKSETVPSSYNVMDAGETKVSLSDKDHKGRIDSLSLIKAHEGVQYACSDAHLEGDYSRKATAKNGKTVENLLKVDGKWLPVTYYSNGAKAGVVIDGMETIVDPTQSPVAILGIVKPMPGSVEGKP